MSNLKRMTMKKLSISILSLALIAGVLSCDTATSSKEGKEQTTEEKAKDKKDDQSKTAQFAYNNGETKVKWTAFKFTEKVGVSGVFEDVEITGTQEGSTPEEVFANAEFTIPVSSINSQDEGRDHKIQEFFFGKLDNSAELTGKMVGFHDDGTATFTMHLNGVEQEVTGEYEISDMVMVLTSEIDVSAWGAESGIAALNKVCDELHKGEDGKSVLWPDVKISIRASMDKN